MNLLPVLLGREDTDHEAKRFHDHADHLALVIRALAQAHLVADFFRAVLGKEQEERFRRWIFTHQFDRAYTPHVIATDRGLR